MPCEGELEARSLGVCAAGARVVLAFFEGLLVHEVG